MDLSAVAMSQNMQMLRGAVSTLVLDKAMGMDAQSMSTLLNDMMVSNPAPQLAPKAYSMDISV